MLGWVDAAVVALYLALVLAIGLGARFFPGKSRAASSNGDGKDVAEYFLAGRNVAWWAVGMSLFSSNIGSEHFVGTSPPSLFSAVPLFLRAYLHDHPNARPGGVRSCQWFGCSPLRVHN
jgi:Na+/proline symporter